MYPEFRSDVCKICKPRAFVLQLQLQDAAVDITRQPKLAAQVAREIACEAEKRSVPWAHVFCSPCSRDRM